MEPEENVNEPLMDTADLCIEEFDIARNLLDEGLRLVQDLYEDPNTDDTYLMGLSKQSYAEYLQSFAMSYTTLASARALFETQVREWDAQDEADGLYEDDYEDTDEE